MSIQAEPATPRRHPTWYLPEGDIVLAAPGEQKAPLLFRVHKAVLSSHSVVFAGMFSLPANPAVNELFEGAPVVQMTDDAAELTKLLAAMYDIGTLGLKRYHPDTPLQVRGVLTLAAKYQVDTVRSHIVRHIEADWPRTLEEWWHFRNAYMSKVKWAELLDDAEESIPSIEQSFPEPVAAIRLAYDFDIPSILPAAFYRLAVTSTYHSWNTEKTVPRAKALFSARWELLTAADWMRLSQAKEKLTSEYRATFWVYDLNDACLNGNPGCKNTRDKMFEDDWKAGCDQPDILFAYTQIILQEPDWRATQWISVCPECKKKIRKHAKQDMDTLWERLPAIFLLNK